MYFFNHIHATTRISPYLTAGSHVLWCAANRSWTPPLLPSSMSTWIAWLSVVGSVFYLIGSLQAPERLADEMAYGIGLPWLAPGWPMLFVGFFLGSLVFFAQSVLMIHEIAVSAEEEGEVGRI
jgi:hypothetical protein